MKYIVSVLLIIVSLCAMGQNVKDLEKRAKKGDVEAQRLTGICYLNGSNTKADEKKAFKWLSLAAEGGDAEAMCKLGNMYEEGRVKDGNIETAWSWYVKAANKGNVESQLKLAYRQKEQGNSVDAKEWFYRAALQNNVNAQYEYAMLLLSENKESEAKMWFKKAADKDHVLSKIKYDAIVQHEREIAEAEAKRLAIEAARHDSIAAVELARQMAEAERQRKQDSIDIAEGRKLPKKDQLLSGCRVFSRTTQATYSYEFKESFFYRELIALCSNDVLAYYGKSRMDDLDKALYKKSEEYRTDLSNFNKKRNEKMAIVFPLDKLSEPEWEFSSTGFSFRALGTKPSPTDNANLLGLMDLVFPVNPNLVKPDDHLKCWHTFKCSNLEKLQEIRANKDNLEMLYIFKPGAKAISRYWSADVMDYVYLVNPIALYLLNSNTGEVVLDLSNCLRKTGIAADKQRIEAYAKNHYNKIKPKKHSTPKQQRCLVCGGKGYTEYYPVGSTVLKRNRCTYCYGKGYTMEYYY